VSELSRRYSERQSAKAEILRLMARPDQVIVVHYSCENFYEDKQDGRSPRITSIAVRHFQSGQTFSYSIQLIAEKKGVSIKDIAAEYDALERIMLLDYFEFVKEHKKHHWVHWNMRDVNYGFPAIEHRCRVLGGLPEIIPDEHKHDLARLLVAMYGRSYVGHPRLKNLVDLNHITAVGMLEGSAEAEKFKKGEYLSLHRSTLRKVDVLANVLERLADGRLKTNASFWEARGISLRVLPEAIKEHPGYTALLVLGSIAAAVVRFTALWELVRGSEQLPP
jgi:hypothetical protein